MSWWTVAVVVAVSAAFRGAVAFWDWRMDRLIRRKLGL